MSFFLLFTGVGLWKFLLIDLFRGSEQPLINSVGNPQKQSVQGFQKKFPDQEISIPSSTSDFGIDIVACRETFDWNTYIKNGGNKLEIPQVDSPLYQLASPGSKVGPNNSNTPEGHVTTDASINTINSINKKTVNNLNPYIFQGCLRQKNFKAIQGAKYSNFNEGNESTKRAFGDDPVLGIYENQGFPAQGNLGNSNRATIDGLSSIFNADQLNEIYSTGGARTGLPRVFSTGPDAYNTTKDNQKIYQGGWCFVENGQIKVRTTRAGTPFDSSLYGRNVKEPWHACARKGKSTVEDRNLQVYQFVYEFKYPNAQQCKKWFDGVTTEECLTFFRNRYGRDIAGNGISGNRLITIITYYGTFDDKYTKWVGWVNPDFYKSRSGTSNSFIQSYDGYLAFVLD